MSTPMPSGFREALTVEGVRLKDSCLEQMFFRQGAYSFLETMRAFQSFFVRHLSIQPEHIRNFADPFIQTLYAEQSQVLLCDPHGFLIDIRSYDFSERMPV
jgi:DNA phosphorothioation-dependent restriction protein DptG